MMKKYIGLVGPISSGIWVVFDLLQKNGFKYYRLSDRIREESLKRNISDSRENWQKVADELRESEGPDVLARKTVEIIKKDNAPLVIVDSVRHPDEVKFLKENLDIFFIGVNAPVEVRFDLMKMRKRGVDPMNFEDFKRLDDYEKDGRGDKKRQSISESLKEVDLLFEHNGDLEELGFLVQTQLQQLGLIKLDPQG